MQPLIRKLLLVSAIYSVCSTLHAEELDIVGLNLGMTEAEARAALIAYGAESDVQEFRQHYSYSDGVDHSLKTEDFVSYISASRKAENIDSLSVFFSPGPQGGRVVAVIRTVDIPTAPPTRRQYVDALNKKYGAPTLEDISTLQWDFPAGKTQCIVGNVGTYSPTQPSILKKIYGANVGTRDATFHKQNIKSLTECASYLTYAMPSGDDSPVTQARAVLVDVAGTAEGELSANEWVNGLAEKARQVREGNGAVPEI